MKKDSDTLACRRHSCVEIILINTRAADESADDRNTAVPLWPSEQQGQSRDMGWLSRKSLSLTHTSCVCPRGYHYTHMLQRMITWKLAELPVLVIRFREPKLLQIKPYVYSLYIFQKQKSKKQETVPQKLHILYLKTACVYNVHDKGEMVYKNSKENKLWTLVERKKYLNKNHKI